MRVMKKGKVVDIPVKQGTVVRLRTGRNGTLTNQRGIVMGSLPADSFSRAYGRQVIVCTFYGKKGRQRFVSSTGAGDVYPVGKVKKIPKQCREAVADYKEMYPALFKKRKR
jgi:hypothetical protein